MHFQSGSFNLMLTSEVSRALLSFECTTKWRMQKQPSQQAFHSDSQVPFHHRRASSSFSQSRPEDGSDVVSFHGSGYDSTLVAGPAAQDRHTTRFSTTAALPGTVLATRECNSPLIIGGRRKTPKPLDPTTPPYHYKQLSRGQTFPVQGGGIPQYFSFWDMITPPNTSASPSDTIAPASSSQTPSTRQDSLPGSLNATVVQGLHTEFVQYSPLPWLEQPIYPFSPMQTTNLQARQSARPWNTDRAPGASRNTYWASVTNGNTLRRWAPRGASPQDHSVHQNSYTNRFQRRNGQPRHLDGSQRGDVLWTTETPYHTARAFGSPSIVRGDASSTVSSIPGGMWGRDQIASPSTQGLGGQPAPARPRNPSHCSDQVRAKYTGTAARHGFSGTG